jgi:NAD+ diphosphatase
MSQGSLHQNTFSAPAIHRATRRRRDETWLAEQLQAPTTRFVLMWRSKNLFADEPTPRPILLAPHDLEGLAEQAGSAIMLGVAEGCTYLALDLPPDDEPPGSLVTAGRRFRDLRSVAALLDRWDAALLAYAKGMVYWRQRHRFCGDCGSPTKGAQGGHLRVCTNPACGQHHFPRTDPAIIVLVVSDGRCLLGRQATWQKGVYATIAGFVEPGESLEAAVAREVEEETGVRVEWACYHSSQPWPFPSSLMLGFTAQAASDVIHLNDGELEDARWFSREEIVEAVGSGVMRLPLEVSISYRLVESWFDAGDLGRLKHLTKTG